MIIAFGPPGSGKGTVSEQLLKKKNFKHLSTGELIRKEMENNKELKEMMASGKLLDDKMVQDMVASYLSDLKEEEKKNLILDGFPRTLDQAKFLKKICDVKVVIAYEIPKEVSIQRIVNRNQGRADDNEETANERWNQYISLTQPIIEFYDKLGKLHIVDGTQDKDKVYKKTLEILGYDE